jgi:hypothetical protein
MALDGAIASPALIASGVMALEGAMASPAAIASGAMASAAMALEGAIASPAAMASEEVGGHAVDAAIASAANPEVVADISRASADTITIIEDFMGYPFGMLTISGRGLPLGPPIKCAQCRSRISHFA